MYANEWRYSVGSLMTYACNHRANCEGQRAIVFLRKLYLKIVLDSFALKLAENRKHTPTLYQIALKF